MIRLADLAEINPSRSAIHLSDGDEVSFIPMGDVGENGRWEHRQTRKVKDVRQGYTYFEEGDVLFAKITPCMENGKGCHAVGLKNGVGFGTTEFHVLRAREDSDARFVYHLSMDQAFRLRAEARMTGSAGQQRVPTSFLETFEVERFTKQEQAAIAEVLTAADDAIARTEALIAKYRRVRTGLMQDLLTKGIDADGRIRSEATHAFKDSPLGRIPVEWTSGCLADVGSWLSGGTPKKSEKRYWSGNIPWATPKDLKGFDVVRTTDYVTPLGIGGTRVAPEGSTFIVVRGMILAHTFPVGYATRDMAFNQDVKAVLPREAVMPRYLAYWFRANGSQLLRLVTAATHGTKRIDMRELLSRSAKQRLEGLRRLPV